MFVCSTMQAGDGVSKSRASLLLCSFKALGGGFWVEAAEFELIWQAVTLLTKGSQLIPVPSMKVTLRERKWQKLGNVGPLKYTALQETVTLLNYYSPEPWGAAARISTSGQELCPALCWEWEAQPAPPNHPVGRRDEGKHSLRANLGMPRVEGRRSHWSARSLLNFPSQTIRTLESPSGAGIGQ